METEVAGSAIAVGSEEAEEAASGAAMAIAEAMAEIGEVTAEAEVGLAMLLPMALLLDREVVMEVGMAEEEVVVVAMEEGTRIAADRETLIWSRCLQEAAIRGAVIREVVTREVVDTATAMPEATAGKARRGRTMEVGMTSRGREGGTDVLRTSPIPKGLDLVRLPTNMQKPFEVTYSTDMHSVRILQT